jgi:hypothetical protein
MPLTLTLSWYCHRPHHATHFNSVLVLSSPFPCNNKFQVPALFLQQQVLGAHPLPKKQDPSAHPFSPLESFVKILFKLSEIFSQEQFLPHPSGLFNLYLGVFTLTELFSQEQFLPHPPGPFNLYLGMFTLTEFKNQMRPFQSSKQL